MTPEEHQGVAQAIAEDAVVADLTEAVNVHENGVEVVYEGDKIVLPLDDLGLPTCPKEWPVKLNNAVVLAARNFLVGLTRARRDALKQWVKEKSEKPRLDEPCPDHIRGRHSLYTLKTLPRGHAVCDRCGASGPMNRHIK